MIWNRNKVNSLTLNSRGYDMTQKTLPVSDEERAERERKIDAGRFAYTPVLTKGGFTLGIAVEGIGGYYKTDYEPVPEYNKAVEWADAINDRRLTRIDALKIVASTMGNHPFRA